MYALDDYAAVFNSYETLNQFIMKARNILGLELKY